MKTKIVISIVEDPRIKKTMCDVFLDNRSLCSNIASETESIYFTKDDIQISTKSQKRMLIKCKNEYRDLRINGKLINIVQKQKIIGVVLTKETVIVTVDHYRLNDPKYFPFDVTEPCEEGNVFAIGLNGDILWKFEDKVDKFIYPSTGGYILQKDNYASFSVLYKIEMFPEHEYYVVTTLASEFYLFDLTDDTFLGKQVIRY